MAVEYDTCTPSSTSSDISSIKGNKISCFKQKKSRYRYVCLGTLARMVHTQIQEKYARNDFLYLIGSEYIKDFHRWVHRYKYEELFVNDFLTPFIASIVLFAVGVKLSNELTAWRF